MLSPVHSFFARLAFGIYDFTFIVLFSALMSSIVTARSYALLVLDFCLMSFLNASPDCLWLYCMLCIGTV